jgi:hypothetical protein
MQQQRGQAPLLLPQEEAGARAETGRWVGCVLLFFVNIFRTLTTMQGLFVIGSCISELKQA